MANVATPHLLHVFSTFVPAGPQVRVAKLLAAFGSEFRHTLVALDGRTEARELLDPSLEVRFVEPPPKAGSLATTLRLRRLLQRERPDLLLTYNFGAIDAVLAAKALGSPRVVHHEDGFRPDEAESFKRRRIWLRRLALAQVDVVVISRNLERIALEHWRHPRERLHFIANGIEVARFEPADGNPRLRDELGLPRTAVVVGAVGHLRPEKNLPRLLEAVAVCARERDVHALLLGHGPERAQLAELAQRADLRGRVHFAGYQADPRAFYRAMDVFALSSDTEQMPIALLEALASSLPALSTDVGDVRTILPPEQARFVIPLGPDCAAGYARALAELAADAELRRSLARANRERVAAEFTAERMIASYRELYGALLR